jgi:hypothetical protein
MNESYEEAMQARTAQTKGWTDGERIDDMLKQLSTSIDELGKPLKDNDNEEFIKSIEAEYDDIAKDREKRDRQDAIIFVVVCVGMVCIAAAWMAMEYWELWP